MKCKIVGVQVMDFTLDNGYHFAGKKIHAIDLDKAPNGLTGNVVTTFKIPDDNPRLALMQIRPDEVYTIYFEQDGKTIGTMMKETAGNQVK